MPWIKVPPENRPIFEKVLPKDERVEALTMFGGIAARANGHVFAGLFGRSVMVLLSEADRTAALALPGASPFDPMGDGRLRSDKVMLPERMMKDSAALRSWIDRALAFTLTLPPKVKPRAKKKRSGARSR